ncbi:MAG: hypothetical protein WDW38_005332 [Sanguina aurantia]
MQCIQRTTASSMSNPLMGSRMSIRVAPTVQQTFGTCMAPTMAKKKGVRLIVTIECTEAKGLGATPSRYCTQKNRKNTPERLELKKYNPFLKKVTVHREIK